MDKERIRRLPTEIVKIICIAIAVLLAILSVRGNRARAQKNDQEVIRIEKTEQKSQKKQSTSLVASRDWGSEDSEILLKIAMAEAEGESVTGKALVMLVVLNRVWSEGFPNTIKDVVFEKGQFSPVEEGGRYWTTEPDEGCYEALSKVMQGWDESEGALYFESCTGGSWHRQNLTFLYQVGNHRFYK